MGGSQFDNENAYPIDPLVRCHIGPLSTKYLLNPPSIPYHLPYASPIKHQSFPTYPTLLYSSLILCL